MNNTIFKVNEKDWRIGRYKIDIPEKTYDTERIAYWQSEVDKNSCSLHACLTVISNLTGQKFSANQRRLLVDYAKQWRSKDGRPSFSSEWGWWMDLAVQCVRDWVKEFYGIEVNYYQVDWKQYRMLTYLKHGVVCGYKVTKSDGVVDLHQDKYNDGIIGNEDFDYQGNHLYSHLVSFWSLKGRGFAQQMVLVDNYEGKTKHNVVKIHHRGLRKLVESGTIFPKGYIYTLKT